MKKLIVILFAVIAFSATVSAQSRSIGIRATYGGELSYQHYLGASNFVEADLGFAVKDGFVLTGIYDFVLGESGPVTIYGGPGAQVIFFNSEDYTGIAPGIAAQLGVDYKFDIPLGISLDWRPRFNFVHGGFGYSSIAFSLRYMF